MRAAAKGGHRPSISARAAIKYLLVLAGVAFATQVRAECSREMLRQLAETYVEAQTTGKPALLPLAAGSYYGENDVKRDIAEGVLTQALTVDFTRSFHDTTQCATFTELVAATHPHPYVIHTRMEATEGGEVTRIESVVTDEDDWVFGAAPFLTRTREEKWDEIPADRRDTREAIQAAAEAYINNWGDPTLPVPHGTPCARLEGRIYTGSRDPQGQTCTMGAFPSADQDRQPALRDRRDRRHRQHLPQLLVDRCRPRTRSPGNAGQPAFPGREWHESLHPRGDGLHDADVREVMQQR